ncbi:MAG: hypothetical protein ACKVVT_15445 [Dehalococcoidia bacterium]
MRLLVIGSSSSSGTGLSDRSLAWPWIVAHELPALIGEPVELTHQVVFPVGPKAIGIAAAAIDSVDPDIAIHSFGFFPAIVSTVSERMRRRHGPRVNRAYRRIVTQAETRLGQPYGWQRRVNVTGRWLARRVLGTETITTRADVMSNLTQIQHLLAHREGLVVVSMCEPTISDAIHRDQPDARRIFAECRAELEAVSRSHRFTIADCATPWAAHPRQGELYLADGLHKSELGQRIQADAILSTVLASGALPSPGGAANGLSAANPPRDPQTSGLASADRRLW